MHHWTESESYTQRFCLIYTVYSIKRSETKTNAAAKTHRLRVRVCRRNVTRSAQAADARERIVVRLSRRTRGHVFILTALTYARIMSASCSSSRRKYCENVLYAGSSKYSAVSNTGTASVTAAAESSPSSSIAAAICASTGEIMFN